MRRALRWLGYTGLTITGLVLAAYAVLYVTSEVKMRRTYAITRSAVPVPSDSASIAEGKRLATIRGCNGCHGSMAQGDTFVNSWVLARVIAPNLTRAVRVYTSEELVGMVRHGVRPDGKSLLGMPSGMFRALTDRDLGTIFAFLRSLPEASGPSRDLSLGPLGRVGVAFGPLLPAAVESDSMAKLGTVYPAAPDKHAFGAYLARTVCSECHGLDLRGDPSGVPPDLRIAGSYPLDAFFTLMRTGKPLHGRDLDLMKEVALERFAHFTDDEIRSLHAFLVARAQMPATAQR